MLAGTTISIADEVASLSLVRTTGMRLVEMGTISLVVDPILAGQSVMEAALLNRLASDLRRNIDS